MIFSDLKKRGGWSRYYVGLWHYQNKKKNSWQNLRCWNISFGVLYSYYNSVLFTISCYNFFKIICVVVSYYIHVRIRAWSKLCSRDWQIWSKCKCEFSKGLVKSKKGYDKKLTAKKRASNFKRVLLKPLMWRR